ncbi:hypothetical protein K443DRAFT_681827, partial [Laccaria amethystina LaAM-08-1]
MHSQKGSATALSHIRIRANSTPIEPSRRGKPNLSPYLASPDYIVFDPGLAYPCKELKSILPISE